LLIYVHKGELLVNRRSLDNRHNTPKDPERGPRPSLPVVGQLFGAEELLLLDEVIVLTVELIET